MSAAETDEPAVADDHGDEPATRRPRRVLMFCLVAAIALAADLVSKILVVANINPDAPSRRVLGGLFYLEQTRNSGAAFSLGTGATVILTGIALVVAVFIARIAGKLRSAWWALAFGLILGGALGNLVDRFFRAPGVGRGHVVDWISVFGPNGKYWPIFNLADSAIVCGAILAALLAILGVDFDGSRERARTGGE